MLFARSFSLRVRDLLQSVGHPPQFLLMFGALRSRKSREGIVIYRQFCSAFQLVELDRDAGERSGVIRADLEGRA